MRFFLDLHGCAKNQVDAELIYGMLTRLGWSATDFAGDADLIIINSCGFIEDAKSESIDAVLSARKTCPNAKILLAGCLSQRYGTELAESLPEAHAFFGNGNLSRLPEIIEDLFPKSAMPLAEPAVLVPDQSELCFGERPHLFSFPRSAYVKISEGCSHSCSFCAIPSIRGPLRSRTDEDIIEEIAALVDSGIFEINLIGQDLAVYGTDRAGHPVSCGKSPLSILLKKISALSGDFRIRLLYLHPDHFPRDILPIMASDARFLPYFDLPFQSGDARILHKMSRLGVPSSYLSLIEEIRATFREKSPYGFAAIRSTFIAGFPGETDDAFANTLSFLEEARFLWAGAFAYSKEEGTAAFDMKPSVPKKKALSRKDALLAAQEAITSEELGQFIDTELLVLVEELIPARENEEEAGCAFAIGRAWFQAPEVDGSVVFAYDDISRDIDGKPVEPGSLVRVKARAVAGCDLDAIAVESGA